MRDNPSVEEMTVFEALDRVKSLRAGYNECVGALYKNVAVEHMQSFLEACVAKWGPKFMECVKRENDAEKCTADYMTHYYGDKGRRDLLFGAPDEVEEQKETT